MDRRKFLFTPTLCAIPLVGSASVSDEPLIEIRNVGPGDGVYEGYRAWRAKMGEHEWGLQYVPGPFDPDKGIRSNSERALFGVFEALRLHATNPSSYYYPFK